MSTIFPDRHAASTAVPGMQAEFEKLGRDGIIVRELWPLARMRQIQGAVINCAPMITEMIKLVELAGTEEVLVPYTMRTMAEGRHFPPSGSPTLAYVGSDVRRYLLCAPPPDAVGRCEAKSFVTDFDLKNCHPAIAYGLSRDHAVDCPTIRSYVEHKSAFIEATLDAIACEFTDAFSVHSLLRAIFCGVVVQNALVLQYPPIQSLVNEMAALRVAVEIAYPEHVEKSRGNLSRFWSFVYATWEWRAIVAMHIGCDAYNAAGDDVAIPRVLLSDSIVVQVQDPDRLTRYMQRMVDALISPTSQIRLTVAPKEHSLPPHLTAPVTVCGLDALQYTGTVIGPITGVRGYDLIVLNASMNMGKTFSMRDLIRREWDGGRVLVFSARIQQAHTARGAFGGIISLRHGVEIPVHFYQTMTHQAAMEGTGIFIVQYESLSAKFTDRCTGFEFIIMDEIRAIMTQFTSDTTNRSALRANFQLFHALTHQADCRTFFLDADTFVDGAVARLVLDLWPDESRRHVRSYFNCGLRHSLRMYTVSGKQDGLFYQQLDASIHGAMDNDPLTRTRPVAVIFRSRTDMERCTQRLGLAGMHGFYAYSRTSTSDDMRVWGDMNAFVSEHVRVLFFTSKVTVGTDITVPFSKIYIVAASKGGCSARDILQMSGRVRNPDDCVIDMLVPSNVMSSRLIETVDELVSDFTARGEANLLLLSASIDHFEFVAGRLRSFRTDDWMQNVKYENERERVNNLGSRFLVSLMRACAIKRITVQWVDATDQASSAAIADATSGVKDILAALSSEHARGLYDATVAMYTADVEAADIEYTRLGASRDRSADDDIRYRMLSQLRVFPAEHTPTYDDMKWLLDVSNAQALNRYFRLTRLDAAQRQLADTTTLLSEKRLFEDHSSIDGVMRARDAIWAAAGGLVDGNRLLVSAVRANMAELNRLVLDGMKVTGRNVARASSKPSTSMVSMLNRFLVLIGMKASRGKRDVYVTVSPDDYVKRFADVVHYTYLEEDVTDDKHESVARRGMRRLDHATQRDILPSKRRCLPKPGKICK